MTHIALITGATAGFGLATARKLAEKGYQLILTGRRADRLKELETELYNKFGTKCQTLVFDVRDKEAVFQQIGNLESDWKKIDLLFNNAGLALGRDYFEEADMDDWETMIDTNLKGVIYVTRAILPGMIANKKGHIINMGSIAAKEIYERGNVYCASKHALDALSRSMRVDLLRHGIKVTAIHPGAAETEFSVVRFKGDTDKATAVYEGFQPLEAEDIAETIWFCASRPAHVCINDLEITCTAQANAYLFHKDNG
ncbi:SDR family NAD(P)-dependent oxidoreductase [Flavihumibacter sp. UBA7668]|uniref:SDR family NAD(P)-dependent oxidoreductase n=1 Tax=Flavihumibacter sp. UBA7668 TaxID=1946542 RepID=UPI0025BB2ABA|nr:SDR family NAD(P)-dependent oxidoreductase [Flavihumibacter sp. UBA7668]